MNLEPATPPGPSWHDLYDRAEREVIDMGVSWRTGEAPDVYVIRPVKGRLIVRFPETQPYYVIHNRLARMLHCEPHREGARWRISRVHFVEVVNLLVSIYGSCGVEIHGRAGDRCDTRCQAARGFECVCQCCGKYHGIGTGVSIGTLIGEHTLLIDVGTVMRQYTATVPLRTGWELAS
jgi:hypothetical protein